MCVHVHKHPIECHFDYQFFQSIQQRYQFENRAKVYSFSYATVGSLQILPIM